jgi:hypothetical protein
VAGDRPTFDTPTASTPTPEWLGAAEHLPWSWAVERLTAERNYWIVSVRRDGFPQARPVWGVWTSIGLLLSVGYGGLQRSAVMDGTPSVPVTVHLDDAVDVLILEGVIDRISGTHAPITFPVDAGLHRAALEAYNAKYDWDFGPDDGDRLNFCFRPRLVYGWHATATSVEGGTRWSFDAD